MSIASEITALNTNLQAAKDAVVAKGGTVGDTGLAGLASEIGTISGGGQTKEPTEWGRLYLLPWTVDFVPRDIYDCTVDSYDIYQIESALINTAGWNPLPEDWKEYTHLGGHYDANMEEWSLDADYYNPETGESLYFSNYCSPQDLIDYWGIEITIDDPWNGPTFNFYYYYTVDVNGDTSQIVLTSSAFYSMGYTDDWWWEMPLLDDTSFKVPREAAAGFDFGTSATSTPNSFLYGTDNLSFVDMTTATSLTTINSGFLSSSKGINSPIIIPSTVTTVGSNFMHRCSNFTSTITVNTSACPSDAASLATLYSNDPMYTVGITIKGPQRSTWLQALPNSTGYNKRKLIDGGA